MKGKKVVVRSKREREGYPTRYNSIIISGAWRGDNFAKKLALLSPLPPPLAPRTGSR